MRKNAPSSPSSHLQSAAGRVVHQWGTWGIDQYTGGLDVALHEVNDVVAIIREAAHEEAHIIFGALSMNSSKTNPHYLNRYGFQPTRGWGLSWRKTAATMKQRYVSEDVFPQIPATDTDNGGRGRGRRTSARTASSTPGYSDLCAASGTLTVQCKSDRRRGDPGSKRWALSLAYDA